MNDGQNCDSYIILQPPLWPEFLATDPEARVRFPARPKKK
jgi:hypothetical protein